MYDNMISGRVVAWILFEVGYIFHATVLGILYVTKPWYISPSGLGLFNIWDSCYARVVAYLGRGEHVLMPKVSQGSLVNIIP